MLTPSASKSLEIAEGLGEGRVQLGDEDRRATHVLSVQSA